MAALVDVALSIVTKVAEYLVQPAILEVKYCLCANNVIQDLQHEKEDLTSERDSLQDRVEQAKGRTEVIEKSVEHWLNGVENLLNEVADLEQTMRANNSSCFQGRFPTWRRYRLCKQMAEKIEAMGKFKGKSDIQPFSHRAPLLGIRYESSENFTYFKSTKKAHDELLKALKDDGILKIGVHGMGGCGKTTLVTEVGKKANKELDLFDEVISVTVSQTPDIRSIQGKMADMLSLKLEEESNEGRAQRLWMCLKEKKRVLIIVDDVWEELVLRDIGIHLSEDYKGVLKILITTRRYEVCDSMDCQRSIPLGLLTEDESWTLFQSRAKIGDRFSKPMDNVPRKLCDECKGLSIAIVTVASSLKGKHKDEWEVALNTLKYSEAIDDHVEEGVRDTFKALKLSYDYLKNKEAKLLFLMCSLFPEDHEIKIEDLLRYAVGLGLGGKLSLESARSRIGASINKLLDCCLLMQDEEKKEFVKMHDLVRDVALWIAKTSNDRKVLVNLRKPLSRLVGDENTRDVFGVSSWYNESKISLQWDAPNLQILLLNTSIRGGTSMDLSESTFEGIKGLKVLSIICRWYSRAPMPMPQSIRLLTNLRTLRLEGWDLGDISFIVYLTTLEVLHLQKCSFNRLPDEIGEKLKRLKLLALVECYVDEDYNGAIGKCAELEELYFTDCHPEKYFIESLGDIVNLSKLERFVIYKNKKDYLFKSNSDLITRARRTLVLEDANISKIGASKRNTLQKAYLVILEGLHGECRNIIPDMIGVEGGMKDLRDLHLLRCEEIECVIDSVSASRQVQHFFEKLELLVIKECPQLQSIFRSECNLGNLKILKIEGGRRLGEALFSMPVAQSLARLEELRISDCDELKHVISCQEKTVSTHHSMMPSLKKVDIRRCRKLKYIFPICCVGEGFARLQHIYIHWASELEYVFGECDHHSSHQYENEKQVVLLLPQLEHLELWKLESLVGLCPEKYNVKWTSPITHLTVDDCPRLTTSWIARMISSEHMDQRIALSKDQEKHLPSNSKLQQIVLRWLPQLINLISCIGPGPTQILNLHCLQHLNVWRCENLKSLFSIAVHRSLPELKSLVITDCQQLEQIIEGNDDELELERISNAQVLFPKLTKVQVYKCHKLKSIFSMSVAQSLAQLEELSISGCDELKHVIASGSEHGHGCNTDTPTTRKEVVSTHYSMMPSLKKVDIGYCSKLKYIFPIAQSLTRLEDLRIFGCDELKHVIATRRNGHYCMMPSLKKVDIGYCSKLKYIFPICCVGEGFARLQHIYIRFSYELEYVFGECDHHSSHQYENENQVVLLLPQLEDLKLWKLGSLVGLCPEKYNVKWTSLITHLTVAYCPKLTTSWIAVMISSEQIHHHMDQRFALSKDQEKHLSSELQQIELTDLPQLNLIGPTPTQILSLCCLQHLHVWRCENLKSLFSIVVHRSSLPELTTLHIGMCQELEQIIEGNDDELEHISNAQVLFPKLTKVRVRFCHKLESLFSVAIVRMLPKLSILDISGADQLKVVFRHGSEDDTTTNGTEIVLPNLTEIILENLPNFVDLCHGFKLHAVKLQIGNCPNIAPSLREIQEQLRESNYQAGESSYVEGSI